MTETRAEAQRLVDEGRVEISSISQFSTEAKVQGDAHRYHTILYKYGSFFCTCTWGSCHSHTRDLCAHAEAIKLAVEKEG